MKEGRALRVETVINSPDDLGVKRRLVNLNELQTKARAVNTRLLATQKAGQDCAISAPLFERVAQPTLHEGQRVPALRFGDPRVMALAASLCVLVHTVVGFTNRSLCAQVNAARQSLHEHAGHLRPATPPPQRSHPQAPRPEPLHPHPEGTRVAAFYTKVHRRILEPLREANKPPAPTELRHALRVIDQTVDNYITNARIRPPA